MCNRRVLVGIIELLERQDIIVDEVYRKLGTNLTQFITRYEQSLSSVMQEKIVIVGADQDSYQIKTNQHQLTSDFISSALCYCTTELLSSRGRPSSVRPPIRKTSFSEPVKQINAKFGGEVPFHHISRPFFFFFFPKFSCIFYFIYFFFTIFFFVFVNMGLYGIKKI